MKESPFTIDELFFSTTDKRGVIIYGNDVFVRVSGYPREELVGSPHNIIRHPDMPRAIFKLFWDTLKRGQMIGAYVKNMAADGSFYWVFALAFPLESGYLSIRLKPSSALFDKVQSLYEEILKKENETDIDEAEQFLHETLKKEGFSSYLDFMLHAAVEELSSRDVKLSSLENQPDLQNSQISKISDETYKILGQCFSVVKDFNRSNDVFLNSTNYLFDEFNKLKFISFNMKIMSATHGDKAVTLGVIAQEFSQTSDEIEKKLESFSSFIGDLAQVMQKCSLELVSLKTQMMMVDFFVKESIAKLKVSEDAFSAMKENQAPFTQLYASSIHNLSAKLINLRSNLSGLAEKFQEIEKFTKGLKIIRLIGAIESAREDDIKASFSYYLQEMNSFVELLITTVGKIRTEHESLIHSASSVEDSLHSVKDNIQDIFNLALEQKNC